MKEKACAAILALTLAGCGNLNNARLAIGGDAVEIDIYKQSVAPSYLAMGANRHFSLSCEEASFKIKGNIETISGNTTSTYTVDMELSTYSFTSAFIYASDHQEEGEEVDAAQKGALSISYDGYLSYQHGGYSYLEQDGFHNLQATFEGGSVTASRGNYDVYQGILSLPLFPHLPSFTSLYSRLLFLDLGSDPLFSQSLFESTNDNIVENAISLRTLEQEIEYKEDILTVSSFGDNVYGIGLYMDNYDYAAFLSAYKTHYLLSGTEEEYMRNYGNFYDKLIMNRLAISQVNNSNGLVNFGINVNCGLNEMDDYVLADDGSLMKFDGLEVDIEVVYNYSQGDNALSAYENLVGESPASSSQSSQ